MPFDAFLEHAQNVPVVPLPLFRRLRVYAFDPEASASLHTTAINDAMIEIAWEEAWEEAVTLGPSNDYLEVVDFDPASDLFYVPLDPNQPLILAQNGLPPCEGSPQFHQQMVFAVAMKTIQLFERALGRKVMWARQVADHPSLVDPDAAATQPINLLGREDELSTSRNASGGNEYIQKLRIYPHALRGRNAYYSPGKTALLFGYFDSENTGSTTRKWIFTCLSHDIIAHETTHAILHGMQRRSVEITNPDSLAFHEAFADTVALFQHFTMLDVIVQQIAATRGALRTENLLMSLARQFGEATGRQGPLRYALAMVREEAGASAGELTRTLLDVVEPHERGGFLVAAIFDAFATIYEKRIADLLRLSIGRSTLDGRELGPDLVRRLGKEAQKSADHVLRMCVRALDYLPPVDVNFGEYLRAIMTADAELVAHDPWRYRVAIAESFRLRGIPVEDCTSTAPDGLIWDSPDLAGLPGLNASHCAGSLLAGLLPEMHLGRNFDYLDSPLSIGSAGCRSNLRAESFRVVLHNRTVARRWLERLSPLDREWETLLGIKKLPDAPASIQRINGSSRPLIEVDDVRLAHRVGPDGQELHQLIVQVSQKRRGYMSEDKQQAADAGVLAARDQRSWECPDFWFRGGSTFHVDLRDGRLKRVIRKRIDDDARLARQRHFRSRGTVHSIDVDVAEPFAALHGGVAS